MPWRKTIFLRTFYSLGLNNFWAGLVPLLTLSTLTMPIKVGCFRRSILLVGPFRTGSSPRFFLSETREETKKKLVRGGTSVGCEQTPRRLSQNFPTDNSAGVGKPDTPVSGPSSGVFQKSCFVSMLGFRV